MNALLHGPLVADVVLAASALEAAALWSWRRWTGQGPGLACVAPTLIAGGCLALALRAALAGGAVWQIGVALIAAFAAHAMDLRRRWPVSAAEPRTGDQRRI